MPSFGDSMADDMQNLPEKSTGLRSSLQLGFLYVGASQSKFQLGSHPVIVTTLRCELKKRAKSESELMVRLW